MLYETEYIKTELRKNIDQAIELLQLDEQYDAPAFSKGYDYGVVRAYEDILKHIEEIEETELENMFKEYMKHEEHINMTDTDFFD